MTRSLTEKVAARLGDRPANLAFRISNTGFFRKRLGASYQRALPSHRSALPKLAAEDSEIVAALNASGYHVTTLDALRLPGSLKMLAAAQRAAVDCEGSARLAAGEGREFTCVSARVIAADPDIFAWGVNERMLDIIEAYLGLPVAYDGLHIIYTVADGREVATRLWHRDREDRKMVKVVVYLHDVNEGGGPLQLISRVDPAQGDGTGYRYAGGADDELSSRLGADYRKDIVTMPGATGTVIFIDTARFFHRGEPAFAEDRAAAFYSYFARRTRHPFFCRRSGLRRAELEHFAKSMKPRQRASTLWFRDLPGLIRLIPPAPV